MKIKINLNKKLTFSLVGALIILTGIFLITAFGTSNPSIFGHSASEIANGTMQGDFVINGTLTAQNGITLGGVKLTSWPTSNASSGQTCHWEESWLTYPNGGSVSEKKSCDVGQCFFKLDGVTCNPGDSSCSGSNYVDSCGKTTFGNNEWLYCCS